MIKRVINKIKVTFFPSQFDLAIKKWFADNGDNILRQEFQLDSASFVMDVGGYCGQWASDIFARYLCEIAVFEPVKEYAEGIRKRFLKNSNIKVYEYGLSGQNRDCDIAVTGDSSSVYKKSVAVETIKLLDVKEFLEQNSIKSVKLIKLNIEGGEYELMERILDSNLAGVFDNFLIQFHQVAPASEERMLAIQKKLAKTHQLKWQYKFVWERWEKKIEG